MSTHDGKQAEGSTELEPNMKIKITKDGPYLVSGNIPLNEETITPTDHHYEYHESKTYPPQESYALCRCGKSKNPPFCDGAHVAAHFDGTETASREPYIDRAREFPGPGLDLLDDNRCAFARFCHREQGEVWTLTEYSGDEKIAEEAIIASTECPSGRLTHYDKEGNPIEPKLSPQITLLQDPEKGVSSAVYVKGGIPLESADGSFYEQRNRYTLCRCGASHNKPFCDASHVSIDYQA